MPRFYFHLCHCNGCIRDDVGCDLPDLAAAHIKAQNLARRVVTFSGLASHEPDWRHWTVMVTDDCQGPTLSVTFAPFVDEPPNYATLQSSASIIDWDQSTTGPTRRGC